MIVLPLLLILVNFIMAAVSSLAAKPHNYVLLENTFPKEQIDHPETLDLRKNYKKRQFQLATLLSVLDCSLFLPTKDSLLMLLFFVLLCLTLTAGFVLQIRYIRKAHELIVKNNWQLTRQPIRIDIAAVLTKNRHLLSKNWLWLSFALLIIGNVLLFFIATRSLFWILLATSLFTWLLFFAGWYGIAHLPIRSLTDDDQLNQQYNDLTKFYWSLLVICSSFIFPVIIFMPMLSLFAVPRLFWPITVIELILLIGFCIGTFSLLLTLRKKQDQLLTQSPSYRYYGEDEYWRYGIYYNPNDSRLMVLDRIGMNLSLNLAKPIGKFFLGILGVVIMGALLIATLPLYVLDYHPDPLPYQVTQQQVILDGPMTKKSMIPLKSITEVKLLKKAPNTAIKENGLATEHYALGHFRVDQHSAMLYVIADSRPVLEIKTNDQTYYYTNKQPQETKAAYQKIHQQTGD